MRVGEMTFDEGHASQLFKLADGHDYTVHRIEREGKPSVYALLGPQGSFTPYITEHQMDKVIALRESPARKVDPAPDFVSPTGFTCPGCGATVTETGVHVGEPPKKEDAPPAPTLPEYPASGKGAVRRSRFFK